MKNLNEELGFMGSLLQKMRVELFDLQHIRVDYDDENRMRQLQSQLIQLAAQFHLEYERIKEKFREELPDPKVIEQIKPFSTSAEALTRLRKFDGNESKDNQLDFFEHEKVNTGQ